MSTTDKQTNLTAKEAVLEHGCYNCGHVRLDKTCNVYCQLRAEGGRCEAYNSWTPLPEPCEDAVSRQAVIDMTGLSEWFDSSDSYNEFVIALSELPPVTPQPKIGHWITLKDAYGDVIEAACSCCNKNGNHKWSICPYCSAIMVKQQESEGE